MDSSLWLLHGAPAELYNIQYYIIHNNVIKTSAKLVNKQLQ